MPIPIEAGGYVVTGGAIGAFVMKMLPILMRRINGKKVDNRNSVRPGKAQICIDRGLKVKEHDVTIQHLCGSIVRIDKQMEMAHTEDREDHQRLLDKLDEMGK